MTSSQMKNQLAGNGSRSDAPVGMRTGHWLRARVCVYYLYVLKCGICYFRFVTYSIYLGLHIVWLVSIGSKHFCVVYCLISIFRRLFPI